MSASHGTQPACAAGTADGSPPVPIEDRVRKACTAEELCVHSVCAGTSAVQHRRRNDGGRTRRHALRTLAGLAWCPRQVREQLHMRDSRMNTSLSTRRGQNDRLMCSQAAARQRSFAYTVDTNGCTSRGPLHLMVGTCRGVHSGFHRFAACVATDNDHQIDLSHRVCAQHALTCRMSREVCLSVSPEPQASRRFRAGVGSKRNFRILGANARNDVNIAKFLRPAKPAKSLLGRSKAAKFRQELALLRLL